MSLYGMMRTSASGMGAQANRLGAVSDNIANSSTVGYKAASIEFSSLVLEAGTSDYAPGAVESHIRHANSQQGAFRYTASVTDIALKGDGFLMVQGSDGKNLMTRAGSFIKDGDGSLVNAAGYKLLGYNTIGGNAGAVTNGTAGLVPVNLAALSLQATPSTAGELTVNFPSTAASVAAGSLPSDNVAGSSYTAKTSLVAYDNLGAEVVLDVYSTKSTTPGVWDVAVFDRSKSTNGGFPYAGGALTSASLTFDATTGKLVTPATGKLSVSIPNGSPLALDMSKVTQLATDYSVVNATVNGNAPSTVDTVEISSDGTLSAVLKNGSRISAFQIPVARVVSPDNLTTVAGNAFQLSDASGNIQIGLAGRDGNASIISSALEQSTVDLASELTDMIQAQSSYTANSKVFQTGADLVAVLNNLRA
jgi:flagellar hook protein FlgE